MVVTVDAGLGRTRERARVDRSLAALERCTREMLEDIAGAPPPLLRYRPNPAEWSVAEVIDHLVRVEISILQVLRANRSGVHRRTAVGAVRNAFLLSLMWLPVAVRVPKGASFVLPKDASADLDGVRREWNKARRDLLEFVNSLSDAELAQGIFKHPVSGWMSIREALDFVRAHLHHHTYQVARLKRQYGRTVQEAGAVSN